MAMVLVVVFQEGQDEIPVLVQLPVRGITMVAHQIANNVCLMIVIHTKSPASAFMLWRLTNVALIILSRSHFIKLLKRQAVFPQPALYVIRFSVVNLGPHSPVYFNTLLVFFSHQAIMISILGNGHPLSSQRAILAPRVKAVFTARSLKELLNLFYQPAVRALFYRYTLFRVS
jgi:hypothetical protein